MYNRWDFFFPLNIGIFSYKISFEGLKVNQLKLAFKEAQETQNESEIEKWGNILRKGREKWMTSNGCSVSFFRSREQIIYPQFPLALRRNLKPILS